MSTFPRSDCRTGKRWFPDRAAAEVAAKITGVPHVHKCKHCKGWHMTRQDPRTRIVNGLTRTQKRRQVRKRAKARRLIEGISPPADQAMTAPPGTT